MSIYISVYMHDNIAYVYTYTYMWVCVSVCVYPTEMILGIPNII